MCVSYDFPQNFICNVQWLATKWMQCHKTDHIIMWTRALKHKLSMLSCCHSVGLTSQRLLCSVLSLLPGWMRWFSSLAWRMRSASRQSTITFCAFPATGTQLRSPWSSLEHKVFVLHLIYLYFVKISFGL